VNPFTFDETTLTLRGPNGVEYRIFEQVRVVISVKESKNRRRWLTMRLADGVNRSEPSGKFVPRKEVITLTKTSIDDTSSSSTATAPDKMECEAPSDCAAPSSASSASTATAAADSATGESSIGAVRGDSTHPLPLSDIFTAAIPDDDEDDAAAQKNAHELGGSRQPDASAAAAAMQIERKQFTSKNEAAQQSDDEDSRTQSTLRSKQKAVKHTLHSADDSEDEQTESGERDASEPDAMQLESQTKLSKGANASAAMASTKPLSNGKKAPPKKQRTQ
jgi:hypothetical protein